MTNDADILKHYMQSQPPLFLWYDIDDDNSGMQTTVFIRWFPASFVSHHFPLTNDAGACKEILYFIG